MKFGLSALIAWALLSTSVHATTGNWSWFHGDAKAPSSSSAPDTSMPPPSASVPGSQDDLPDRSACVAEILSAQKKYGIPNNILLGIGLQETGHRDGDGNLTVWPWSANAAGEGRWFKKRSEAIRWVEAKLSSGVRSVDVGCMQINLRWHPKAFASVAEGYTPEKNVDYAARLLVRLRKQTGSWELAAGSYHSFTPKYRTRYLKSLRKKIAFANQKVGEFRQNVRADGNILERIARTSMNKVASAPDIDVSSTSSTEGSAGLWSSHRSGSGPASLFSNGSISPLFGGN